MVEHPTTDMTDAEKKIIWAFAQGDRSKREEAIAIHRQWIPALGVRGTPEQCYMAEVDSPAPDLSYREHLRLAMLRQHNHQDAMEERH